MFPHANLFLWSLFLCVVLLSGNTLADRFYFGPDCTGNHRAFRVEDYDRCYPTLGGGYARSIQSDSSGQPEQWVAFRRRQGGAKCGYEVCSFNNLNSRCCTSRSKVISGLSVYRIRNMAGTQEEAEASESRNRTINANSDHLDKDWLAAAAQAKGPPEGLDVAGTEWEPKDCAEITDGEGFIELPDGTYHSIGVGVVKVTVEELQRQLQAKGKPALSDAKIAELREDGFVE